MRKGLATVEMALGVTVALIIAGGTFLGYNAVQDNAKNRDRGTNQAPPTSYTGPLYVIDALGDGRPGYYARAYFEKEPGCVEFDDIDNYYHLFCSHYTITKVQ